MASGHTASPGGAFLLTRSEALDPDHAVVFMPLPRCRGPWGEVPAPGLSLISSPPGTSCTDLLPVARMFPALPLLTAFAHAVPASECPSPGRPAATVAPSGLAWVSPPWTPGLPWPWFRPLSPLATRACSFLLRPCASCKRLAGRAPVCPLTGTCALGLRGSQGLWDLPNSWRPLPRPSARGGGEGRRRLGAGLGCPGTSPHCRCPAPCRLPAGLRSLGWWEVSGPPHWDGVRVGS